MFLKKLMMTAVAAGALVAAAPAAAAPITVGQWYTFGFSGQGSAIGNGNGFSLGTNPVAVAAPDSPWTFVLASVGSITVVDGFISGDQFAISDFGSAIGTTSAPTTGSSCGSDISACLANASMSKGTFSLAAGSHSITGTLPTSVGAGAGFFIVRGSDIAAVPEPATWAMMLVGFGAMGVSMRRRRVAVLRAVA